ncbi:MAG: hypothetical protein IPG23_05730 [Burkholderiales bacterium]|nr:hypothetical protein [Burkholderiales bacterium]
MSNAQLAEKILTNMGVYKLASGAVNTDLVTLVVDAFTLLPNDRGQLVLRLAEILTTLEFATGALSIYNAAAVSWNDEVTATLAYSGISTNTTESATGDNTDLLKSYKLSPVSVAAVSEGATALFNLATSGVKDGTTIAHTLSGVSAADVTGSLTGVAPQLLVAKPLSLLPWLQTTPTKASKP